MGKLVLAERPALLIMARSKARAAATSVAWSPREVVLPWEEIWWGDGWEGERKREKERDSRKKRGEGKGEKKEGFCFFFRQTALSCASSGI